MCYGPAINIDRSVDMPDTSLDANEVMTLLGIKPQTLYAYASRGLLRRTSAPGSKRSLYAREDVETMLARKVQRDAPTAEAAPSLAIPGSISSTITEITADGPRYRGRDARALAVRPGRLENVAELLWTGVLMDEPVSWDFDPFPPSLESAISALQHGEGHVPILRVMAAASIALGQSAANELRSGNTARLARRLVYTYAGCLAHLRTPGRFVRPKEDESVAGLALRALGAKPSPAAQAALNALLIVCADHELSPATYAARVVASTGAGLHACLIAAIAGHSGHVLGGGCDRVEDFFAVRQSPARLRESAAAAGRGELNLPGFGSALYPQGDPRATLLLDIAAGLAAPKSLADIQYLVEVAQSEAGLPVSMEVGLVAVSRALGLPPRSASALWAVGRSVGWVAHVMEQRLSGSLIRPRARRRGV